LFDIIRNNSSGFFAEIIESVNLDMLAQQLATLMNISLFSISQIEIIDNGRSLSFTVIDQPGSNTSQVVVLAFIDEVQNLHTTNQTLLGLHIKSIGHTIFIGPNPGTVLIVLVRC
jgi:hypothetical protein